MKIKIDKDGQLAIERAGKFKGQGCPHDNDGAKCGDWCPKFEEPILGVDPEVNDFMVICEDKALSGEIIDERKREDEK